MSTYQEHCDECREKLGRPHWAVHRYLDAYAKQYFPSDQHRLHRHHQAGVEEVRVRWGAEAEKAAILHILADVAAYGMDHIPSTEEAEQLWGQEVMHHPNGKMEIRKRMECD